MSNYLNILFIMRKVSIPDQILQELADELVKVTGAKVSYKSRVVMCIKGGNHDLPFDVLSQAKDKFGDILKDYSILWIADAQEEANYAAMNAENSLNANLNEGGYDENQGVIADNQADNHDENTSEKAPDKDKMKCVILLDGPTILTILLARRFGGAASGSSLWLVYNCSYSQSHYGYKGDCIPCSSEIISYMEQLFINH